MSTNKGDPASPNIRQFPKSASLLHSRSGGSGAQIVVAITAALAVCYFAKLVLITIFTSILLAFLLEPIVSRLQRWRLPRPAGSFVAVSLLMVCLYVVAYFSYNKALDFVDDLPRFTEKIRQTTLRFHRQAAKLEQSTEALIPGPPSQPGDVRITPKTTWTDWLTSSMSGITELLVTISFIPFLTYFMLSWRDRTRKATVKLFRPENREIADHTLGGIAGMLHGFLTGNLICGLFLSAASIVAFGAFNIPYFYFLGVLSGFLSLVPYLGVALAILPPVAAGLGVLNGEEIFAIAGIVVGLHVVGINVLFPKVIGKRLQLNPLVVTIALLVWGWIWGAMGLVLAIPITGALKIIFDHIEGLQPLGEWMAE